MTNGGGLSDFVIAGMVGFPIPYASGSIIRSIVSEANSIDVRGLSSGIYFLEIRVQPKCIGLLRYRRVKTSFFLSEAVSLPFQECVSCFFCAIQQRGHPAGLPRHLCIQQAKFE